MSVELWLAFAAASTVLVAIPGPTVLLVVSYAVARGPRIAATTALGVAIGDAIAVTACLLGLGAVIMASATAYTVLKWVGAAYLVWLGLRMIRHAGDDRPAAPERAQGAVLRHAALVTALNPKGYGFFLAFLPQFIDPAAAYAPQAAILGASFVVIGAANALIYALAAGHLQSRLARPAVRAWLERAGGGTLLALGVATAASRRAA